MERITMKRAIQLFALLLTSVIILTGCGKGGGVSRGQNEPEPVGDPAQNGVEGIATKGRISGGTVTVVDANGDEIPVQPSYHNQIYFPGATATTGADGSYSIDFTPTNTPIPVPIQVIIDTTGATAVCDVDNAGTDDDCLNADGTYSAFGGTFTLPPGLVIRAVQRDLPTPVAGGARRTVNASPFSEMASVIALAGGATLTTQAVDDANAQVLGSLQLLFPTIDVNADLATGGLNAMYIPDITNLANEDTGSLNASNFALAALAATFAGLVDPDDPAFADLNAVIATLSAAFSDGVTNGDLGIIGTAAAAAYDTIVAELTAIDDVALPDDLSLADMGSIADRAAAETVVFLSDPDGIPTIPPVDEPPPTPPTDGEAALTSTKAFIDLLSDLVDNFVDLTDYTDSGAVAASSPLGLGDAQFRWIAEVNGEDSTATIENLIDGINEAAHAIKLGEGTGDNSDTIVATGEALSYTVVGTEDDDGSTFTVTEATSVSGGVTLTVASGTRTVVEVEGVETTGTFSATGVKLVTADSNGTLQTFTGWMSATFTAEEGGLGLTSLTMVGNVNVAAVAGGTAGGDWGTEIEWTGVTGTVAEDVIPVIAGTWSATFNVAVTGEDELIISAEGTRGQGTGTVSFGIGLGDIAFHGTVSREVAEDGDITDTTTLSDANAQVTLTLTILLPVEGSSSATGVLSSLGIQTGTVDTNGLITYSDDSIQSLNAAIFN